MTKALLLCLVSLPVMAQRPPAKIREYRQVHEHALLSEYVSLLSIPNIVGDTASDMRKNAEAVAEMMRRRGIQPRLLPGPTPDVPPVVFGEVKVPGATQTVVFYAHYDGQPVIPTAWAPGTAPFKPVLATNSIENGGKIVPFPKPGEAINPQHRIIARAASDDKAGIFAILAGYEALTKSGGKPTANLKFFFEGEEEVGSKHLADFLTNYRDLLAADLWVFCDGPVHQSERKQVVFGCRGDVNLEIKVYGPRRPLHSGHYGNWAPNPGMGLAKLIASMKDETGNVLVKGFYDDVIPLSESEKKAIAAIPFYDETIRQELGFNRPEGAARLAELITRPSLNVSGLQSAGVGRQAANVIPATATAALDLRLVPGNDPQRQQQKIVAHLRAQGYFVTDREPTDQERLTYPMLARVTMQKGYRAQRTPLDLPIAQRVVKAVQSTATEPIVLQPMLGGSLPLYLFEEILNTNAIVTVPVVNSDNNQHGENENVRVQNLWDGIETLAAVMQL